MITTAFLLITNLLLIDSIVIYPAWSRPVCTDSQHLLEWYTNFRHDVGRYHNEFPADCIQEFHLPNPIAREGADGVWIAAGDLLTLQKLIYSDGTSRYQIVAVSSGSDT